MPIAIYHCVRMVGSIIEDEDEEGTEKRLLCLDPLTSRFMMGEEMGIVAVVDSLAVLREQSMWRQSGTDWDVPRRPEKFSLSGEDSGIPPTRLGFIARSPAHNPRSASAVTGWDSRDACGNERTAQQIHG